MAKLTAKARKAIPTKKFAGPNRSFPIEDKVHAQKAIQLAPRAVKAGSITPAQASTIKAKARAKLGKSDPKPGNMQQRQSNVKIGMAKPEKDPHEVMRGHYIYK